MSEPTQIPALNLKVARHLEAKAQEFEQTGKESYRIWAFKKAAKAVRQEPRSLWGIYRSKGLKGLQGIKGIGHRIAWEIVNQFKDKD